MNPAILAAVVTTTNNGTKLQETGNPGILWMFIGVALFALFILILMIIVWIRNSEFKKGDKKNEI